jgi:hypothetical protein
MIKKWNEFDEFVEVKDPMKLLGNLIPDKIYGISYRTMFKENDYKVIINQLDHDVEFLLIKDKNLTDSIFKEVSSSIKENLLDYDSPSIVSVFHMKEYDLFVKIDSGHYELSKFNVGQYEIIAHFSSSEQIENLEIKKAFEKL